MKITDEEIQARKKRDKIAKASLACEGITFTAEEDALFAEIDRIGLNAEQADAKIRDYFARTPKATDD